MKKKKTWLALIMILAMVMGMLPTSAFALKDDNHTHTDDCYIQAGALVCPLPECPAHAHTQDCYCPGGELICDLDEDENHTHDDSCYCPGGELICALEETDGHTHTDDCYAAETTLICGYDDEPAVREDSAEELYNAFLNAADEDIITLGSDIIYEADAFGVITVGKNITLNCDKYKITVNEKALFNIAQNGSLTLKNAEITAANDDIIRENHGTLKVVSTKADGFTVADCVIEENYGTVNLNNMTFTDGSEVVYGNYGGNVTITNSQITSQSSVVDSMYGGTLTLENVNVTAEYAAAENMNNCDEYEDYPYGHGQTIIKSGIFNAESFNSSLSNNNEWIIYGGTFKISDYPFYLDEANTGLTIHDGTFEIASNRNLIENSGKNSGIKIYGGTFTAQNTVISNNGGDCYLYGGEFISKNGEPCFEVASNGGEFFIDNEHKADPTAWENASHVKIVPNVINVKFYAENGLLSEQSDSPNNITAPTVEANKAGYPFLYWETKDKKPVESLTVLTEDTDLYAVYADRTYTVSFNDNGNVTTQTVTAATVLGEVAGLDRSDNGDNFFAWRLDDAYVDQKSTLKVYTDLTLTAFYADKVANLDELKAALQAHKPAIALTADIPITETIVVDYTCAINGAGFSLIRPEGFEGTLLGVRNSTDDGENPDAATVFTAKNLVFDGQNFEAYSSCLYVSSGASVVMTDSTFKNNNAVNWRNAPYTISISNARCYGGAVYTEENAQVNLKNCTLSNNKAANEGGALYANKETEIKLQDCVFENNYTEENGGALYANQGSSIYLNKCTLKQNQADSYGGAAMFDGAAVEMTKCMIDSNQANDGGGLSLQHCDRVKLTDTAISHNTASEGGGMEITRSLVHFYGDSSLSYNNAEKNGGGLNSQNGGDIANTVLYLHDDSSIAYNTAEKNGGGAYLWEQQIVMYDNSSIHHNDAVQNGGGVCAGEYGIIQRGGTIRDNHAGGCGGGVYTSHEDTSFMNGMIYDNTADTSGDDLYQDLSGRSTLYASQPNRLYNDGDSLKLGTVIVKPITNYHENDLSTVSVPFYGWFIDGAENYVYKYDKYFGKLSDGSWGYYWGYKWVYDGTYSERYANITDSTLVSRENGNLDFLQGKLSKTGGKAIWYGLLLAYDANFADDNGDTAYQYDDQAYAPNSNATAKDNMFTRLDYKFKGWNTQPDGTGDSFKSGDTIAFTTDSQVLYAQWEKLLKVTYQFTPDPVYGIPVDAILPIDNTAYESGQTVSLAAAPTTAWTTSDGTENGLPGTWSFITWDKENNFAITEDTTIYGVWKFTPAPGSLTVSKTTSGNGASTSQDFTFTVALSAANGKPLSGSFDDITFDADGKYSFTLKSGESRTISALPHGTNYTVSESENAGYIVTVNNTDAVSASGTITAGEAAIASFNNHKDKKTAAALLSATRLKLL